MFHQPSPRSTAAADRISKTWRAAACCMLLALCPLGLPAAEQEGDRRISWRAVLFDGLKAGWASSERSHQAEGVLTRERMALEIRRGGVVIALSSMEETLEAHDGTPLRFRAEQQVSAERVVHSGQRRADGRFDVVSEIGGERSERVIELAPETLFFEGQRQRILQQGLTPGSVVEFLAFQPLMQDSVRVRTEIHAPGTVEVLQQDLDLVEVSQALYYGNRPVQVRAAVDADFDPVRISMDMQGMRIELVRCDQACAQAPSQSPEFLTQLLLQAPADARPQPDASMRYRFSGVDLSELPATGHQRVHDGWLQVDPQPRRQSIDAAELERARAATAWLQSDHPEIRELAARALGADDATPLERMRTAEDYVRRHIHGKTLAVGYASALETLRSQRGDCTEHALLLAALGRAEGIPTRVVTGFARVAGFAGKEDVFVPHAWTEAYIDGAWHGFDAALTGFGSGHIALAVGDGDPTRFYASMELLTSLQVEQISAVAASGARP